MFSSSSACKRPMCQAVAISLLTVDGPVMAKTCMSGFNNIIVNAIQSCAFVKIIVIGKRSQYHLTGG
jgi:hypothetical protein